MTLQDAGQSWPEVLFFTPDDDLKPFLTTIYQVTTTGQVRDHLHPEWGNIRIAVSGEWYVEAAGRAPVVPPAAALFGPTDRTSVFGGDGMVLGIGLTPLGWLRLVAEPANRLANRVVNLASTWGDAATALTEALKRATDGPARALCAQEAVRAQLRPARADDDVALLQSLLVSGDIATVPEFAAQTHLSERSLHRLCLRAFGFGPKRLLRRQRFLRTLEQVGDRLDQPLSGLIDVHYCDQSHFIREFRAFMGMAPLAYFHAPRQVMRRAAAARAAMFGASVQGLHAA